MTNLFSYFNEVDVFYEYLKLYGRANRSLLPKDKMEYLLRFWAENKAKFSAAFGDKLILKKPVVYEMDEDELVYSFNELGYLNNYFIVENYLVALDEKFQKQPELKEKLAQLIVNARDLALNSYSGDTFSIPKEFTKNGKELKINKGCKVIKIFKKILNALDIAEADYEDLRLAHARILNQKRLVGNLCISIHPLDFVTMSDNTLGWDTCTSWTTEDPGEYRLGTFEMMNSPCVIIAYFELPECPYEIGAYKWNNKHWRQLFIVTEDIIIGNKQYNYQNDYFEQTALSWIKELCENRLNWGPYIPTPFRVNNLQDIKVGKKFVTINLFTNAMYNDFGMNHKAYISEKISKTTLDINYSGPATCIDCGQVVEQKADSINVECIQCSGLKYCPHCDSYVYSYIEVDGEIYCQDCYSSFVCPLCEKSIEDKKLYIDLIIKDEDNNDYSFFNHKLVAEVCPHCYSSLCKAKIDFKDNSINLLNLTDLDLISLNLPLRSFSKVRDAATYEERKELCSKFFSY